MADDGSVRCNVVDQGPEDPQDISCLPDNLGWVGQIDKCLDLGDEGLDVSPGSLQQRGGGLDAGDTLLHAVDADVVLVVDDPVDDHSGVGVGGELSEGGLDRFSEVPGLGDDVHIVGEVSDDRGSIANVPIHCRVTSIVVGRGEIILWTSTQQSNEGKEEGKGLHDACLRF